MSRYGNSKMRIALLTVMALLIVVGINHAMAQTAGGAAGGGSAAATGNGTPPVATGQGIFSLVLSNLDPIFFTILALSIWGVTLIIQGFMNNRQSVFMPPATTALIREMIAQKRFKELVEFTDADGSFVSRSLNPALKRAPEFADMKEAMETAVGEQTAEQFRKIEYLNIIGNLGPLLGLLGTVVGMIDAFQALNNSGGTASPGVLAGGISKALTHTMLGLMLAVPCLAAFGILRTMVDRLTIRGALEAEDLLLMIKPADSRPAPGSAARTAGQQAALPAARRMPAPNPGGTFTGTLPAIQE